MPQITRGGVLDPHDRLPQGEARRCIEGAERLGAPLTPEQLKRINEAIEAYEIKPRTEAEEKLAAFKLQLQIYEIISEEVESPEQPRTAEQPGWLDRIARALAKWITRLGHKTEDEFADRVDWSKAQQGPKSRPPKTP